MAPARDDTRALEARVQRLLHRCVEWSQSGRHRKILAEVERALPDARGEPQLLAMLLIWKSLALLAMGLGEKALPAATASWQLDPSPQACHLVATALDTVGSPDEAEDMLRLGCEVFPEAPHLQVQLAMMLADQGRLPEALDALGSIIPSSDLPEEVQVFVFGLKANLLATLGRWSEAQTMLEEGLESHPASPLLAEARKSIERAWQRARAEQELVGSWRAGLEPIAGGGAELDDAIVHCGAILELGPLEILAAQRLLRAFLAADALRLLAPEAWAAAFLVAVLEIDGEHPSAAAVARSVAARPSTVQAALRRLRAFLGALQPELARRSFASSTNPRLGERRPTPERVTRRGNVVAFPGRHGGQERR